MTDQSAPTAVVTGANRGIGFAVARQLVDQGFRTMLLARDARSGALARDLLGARAELVVGDLSSPRTTRTAADALLDACPRLDVLVHNAGIWPVGLDRNEDGHEQAFATNHLAPFVLNHALYERLQASRARVVQVSAGLYVKGRVDLQRTPSGGDYHWMRTYCTTKLCNLLLVPLFAQRWEQAGVTVNALHPGVIRSRLGDRGGPIGMAARLVKRRWASPEEGARPIVRLATDPALAAASGRYWFEFGEQPLQPPADDAVTAEAVWEQAAQLTGVSRPLVA